MANVVKHQATEERVLEGDTVITPKGPRVVLMTGYDGRNGARVWVKHPQRVGDRDVFAASECGCFVTSEDC